MQADRTTRKTRLRQYKIAGGLFAVAVIVIADPRWLFFALGTVVVAAGCAIRFWAYGYLEKNQTLAINGPYAYTRNPAYFGSFVVMIGLFIAGGNPATVRGLIVWVLGAIAIGVFLTVYMPAKCTREYPRLRATFPDAFDRHAATTPDFFPRLTGVDCPAGGTFSWRHLHRSREIKRPIFIALALALMWVI